MIYALFLWNYTFRFLLEIIVLKWGFVKFQFVGRILHGLTGREWACVVKGGWETASGAYPADGGMPGFLVRLSRRWHKRLCKNCPKLTSYIVAFTMVLGSDSWAVFTLMSSPAKAYTKAGQIPPSAGYAPDAVLSTFWGHRQFTVCRGCHQKFWLWVFVVVSYMQISASSLVWYFDSEI